MARSGEILSAAGTQSEEAFTESLIASLPSIYEKEKPDTVLHKIYDALAKELVKADIVLESVGNNNYLSIAVTNELLIRGIGDKDRLKNENAFELDKIRFNAPGTSISQNTILSSGENSIQLYFIPEDIDFIIFNANDKTQTPLNFPTTFSNETNTLTITSSQSGPFTIAYRDTGNVVRLNRNITVPVGLFKLGWNEGGWNELGWSE